MTHSEISRNQRYWVKSDSQPSWAFLKVFRQLEQFGCVFIGSSIL